LSEKKGKKKVKAEEDEDEDEDEDEEFDDEFEDDFEDEKDEDEDEDEEEEYEPEPDSYDGFKQSDDEAPPTRVLKLEVGEEVRGRLVKKEKQTSTDKHGNRIVSWLYQILSPGEDEPWRIYGTTVLDQWMANKEEGDRLGLVRDEDKPPKIAGRQPTQMYHTYTIVKGKKKKHSKKKHRPEKKTKKKVHKHDDDEEE